MTTAFVVRFQGLPRDFVARKWQIPKHTLPFQPLPSGTRCVHITQKRSSFINGQGDRRPQEISLEDARRWGSNGQDDTEVIYAQGRTADTSKRFCLRMILNAEHSTQRGVHSGTFKVYSRLVRDAGFHSKHLLNAEGLFVPVHYGMWVMDTGDWAGIVLFSLTQWCGVQWNELKHTKMNTAANRILIGRTFEALHDFGVVHGGLNNGYDLRHVLIDIFDPDVPRDDILDGKAPCYIVGFSEASANHQCTRRLPILPLDAFPPMRNVDQQVGCIETANALILLKLMSASNKLTPVSKALEWHDKYSALHPDIPNSHVLIAQRAKLYFTVPEVYSDVDVSFESRDLHARATITRRIDSDSDEEPRSPTTASEASASAAAADSASPDLASDALEKVVTKLRLFKLGDRFSPALA